MSKFTLSPFFRVNVVGAWLAGTSGNCMGEFVVGRSEVDEGRTAPVRSCNVKRGHPFSVHVGPASLVRVTLA
jgi:hypothetical protein